MKAETTPFWGVLVAMVLAGLWWWTHFDMVTFDERENLQFSRPQIEKDASRMGRRISTITINDLTPGELVRFKTQRTRAWTLTARVVAIAGKRVSIEGKQVLVNGEKVDDTYGRSLTDHDYMPELIVPDGCVFVLNDRRWGHGADRCDSRALGPIPLASITHRFSPKERQAARKGKLR